MKCTILNRNYPPHSGITGQSANELAGYLEQAGVEVHVVTVGRNYQSGGAMGHGVHGTVHQLRHIYNGKNKLLRLFSSLIEGWKMARKAISLNKGPLISMTDPPLLNFWVSRMAMRKSIPWIYWSMDVYPEAFAAAKLVTANNPVYQYLKRQLRKAPPSALIALGANQARFIQQDYREPLRTIVLPCGITHSPQSDDIPEWAAKNGKVILGYIGNLGEAHNDKFIKAVIDEIDITKHRFVLVAYGSKSQAVLDYARGRDGVVVLDRVAREHLWLIDIHLVTLLPEWDHVCVPSKAVSAICEGANVYMYCLSENDNWELLKEGSWRVDPALEIRNQVQHFFSELNYTEINSAKVRAIQVSNRLLKLKSVAFQQIVSLVKACQS